MQVDEYNLSIIVGLGFKGIGNHGFEPSYIGLLRIELASPN